MERERAQAACHARGEERSNGQWLCDDVPDRRVVFLRFFEHVPFANEMHRFERFLKYAIAHAIAVDRLRRLPSATAGLRG